MMFGGRERRDDASCSEGYYFICPRCNGLVDANTDVDSVSASDVKVITNILNCSSLQGDEYARVRADLLRALQEARAAGTKAKSGL